MKVFQYQAVGMAFVKAVEAEALRLSGRARADDHTPGHARVPPRRLKWSRGSLPCGESVRDKSFVLAPVRY